MARQRSGSAEQTWIERFRRYEHSGLSVAAFCTREGVSVASFYAWRRWLNGAADQDAAGVEVGRDPGRALFVPNSVRPASAARDVRIELAGGVVVHLPLDVDECLLRTCLRAAVDVAAEVEGR